MLGRLFKERKCCLHLGCCCGLLRGRAVAHRDCTWLPGGDFYGAIMVISKHKFFHVPNIVKGSNSAPCLLL